LKIATVFVERRGNLLQNGLFRFNRHKSRWKARIYTDEKTTFLKRALRLKGKKEKLNFEIA